MIRGKIYIQGQEIETGTLLMFNYNNFGYNERTIMTAGVVKEIDTKQDRIYIKWRDELPVYRYRLGELQNTTSLLINGKAVRTMTILKRRIKRYTKC